MNDQATSESISWPSPTRAWYATAVLFIAYACSFIDRIILNMLVGPIRTDLSISDTQFSLLQGIAFVFFYTLMGIPIARLADTYSRRIIVATGILIWSLMTASCGLARNFWQLFSARIGVGAGEATLSPSAYSLMNDYFPPKTRPLAFGVYSAGVSVGSGLAYMVGGVVITLVSSMSEVRVPVVGALHPWQATFMLVGLPGLLIAALMLTVKEPKRLGLLAADQGSADAPRQLPFSQVIAFAGSRWRTFVPMFTGVGFMILLGFGFSSWVPAFFMRTYGWSAMEFGITYGLIIIVFGTLGHAAAGGLAAWLSAKGYTDANLRAALIGSVIVGPAAIIGPLVSSPGLALFFFAIIGFFSGFSFTLAPAAIQLVTPNQMRAQISAFYLFTMNMIGSGLGPTVIALMTDYLFKDDNLIGYSMSLTAAIFAPLACIMLWLSLKPFQQSFEEAKAWAGAAN